MFFRVLGVFFEKNTRNTCGIGFMVLTLYQKFEICKNNGQESNTNHVARFSLLGFLS